MVSAPNIGQLKSPHVLAGKYKLCNNAIGTAVIFSSENRRAGFVKSRAGMLTLTEVSFEAKWDRLYHAKGETHTRVMLTQTETPLSTAAGLPSFEVHAPERSIPVEAFMGI